MPDLLANRTMSPRRRTLVIGALTLGGFAFGISEFATMGLLNEIAGELIHDAPTAESALAQAGWLVTLYAIGVFLGAPTIGVLAARRSQSSLALWMLGAAAVANLATALSPSFPFAMVGRFVAGVPHGAYLGVAALLAGRMLGPGRQGQGVALALSGLTVANLLGVPVATWAGQNLGWRWIFAAVAVIFVATLVALRVLMPRVDGDPRAVPRAELRAFTRPKFWLVIAVGAIGFGGFFAVYTYINEVTVSVAHLPSSAVPFVLFAMGLGMVLGNLIGGWAADKSVPRTVFTGLGMLAVALIAYMMFASSPVGLFVTVFAISLAAWIFTPAVQSWLIDAAGEQRLLGATMNHAAFNMANSLGAWGGGLAIASGAGLLSPAGVGLGFAAMGALLAVIVLVFAGARPSSTATDRASGKNA